MVRLKLPPTTYRDLYLSKGSLLNQVQIKEKTL
ncbi:hypothetical protein VAA_01710 [Vibrio anguillarum 775]|nr:hypothetical protein VAA_01710 [Vibrio anguillarum 775]